MGYVPAVPVIRRTEVFSNWLTAMRDIRARARILVRIDRLAVGNPGQVASVGGGVSELKIDYGSGYRVYYISRGDDLVVLLCGGDKASQPRDIRQAKALVEALTEEDYGEDDPTS